MDSSLRPWGLRRAWALECRVWELGRCEVKGRLMDLQFRLKSNVGTEVGSGSCGSKIVMLVCRL